MKIINNVYIIYIFTLKFFLFFFFFKMSHMICHWWIRENTTLSVSFFFLVFVEFFCISRCKKYKGAGVVYGLSSFSSLGLAPPNIELLCAVSANAFTGSFTVLGCSFSLGLPDVSEITYRYIHITKNSHRYSSIQE